MFRDNKNFYPTPENLIEKMLKDIDFTFIKTILEPSAGKGNIVGWLGEKVGKESDRYGGHYNYSVDCIELDENLQTILRNSDFGVPCHLVHNDFLTYQTYKRYDLIINVIQFKSK